MTADSGKRATRLRWRTLQGFAIATALGVIAASQHYVSARVEGEPVAFVAAVLLTMPFWYLWALLAPVVFWLARRLPLERTRLVSRGISHLVFAMVLSSVHTAVIFQIIWASRSQLTESVAELSYLTLFMAYASYQLSSNLLAYCAIAGVAHALDYYRRYRERELATTRLSEQLAQAQIRALRMQLNPHFLFNAMNSIAMLVRHQQRDEAVRTVAGLSDLLRYVLEDTREVEVPLRQELDFVERYLAIEQVRFRDRLEVRIDADHDTLDAQVPNLILQPLVENAIRHGIAKRTAAKLVAITAHRTDDNLVLDVIDDGPGLSGVARMGNSVGISNTRARLAQLYGSQQKLQLRNAPSQGVIATISLPFHTHPLSGPEQQ